MKIKFDELEREYLSENDTDTDEMYYLKKGILELPYTDKALILLYAECGSYSKVAKILGVSSTTAFNQIKKIKSKIHI